LISSVGVIGGGFAGLYTAYLMAREGIDVVVYEEDPQVGLPQHCTGIVSASVYQLLRRALGRDVATNILRRLEVRGRRSSAVLRARSRAYVIDRVLVERLLMRKCLDEGATVLLSTRAVATSRGVVAYLSARGRGRSRHDLIVDAGGFKSAARRAGLRGMLPAYQVDLEVDGGDLDKAVVSFDKGLNPDFFVWEVPVRRGGRGVVLRVGTASRTRNPAEVVERYVRSAGLPWKPIRAYGGHLLLRGPIRPLYDPSAHVAYVGDSAGQTKPTTGGGLAYILSAAEALRDAICQGDPGLYEREWLRTWGGEVALQKTMRAVAGAMPQPLIDAAAFVQTSVE